MDFSRLNEISTPTPVREISEIYQKYGVRLFVKEDYMTHPVLSGNKWRKLEGNLKHIQANNYSGIISFGGAHSNHLFALAGVKRLIDIPVIMLVRGDGYDAENETLSYAKESGVELIFVDRASYREKEYGLIARDIIGQYPDYFVIPEGGSNHYAFSGVQNLYDEILTQLPYFTHIVLSMGTGGTAASLLSCLTNPQIQLMVYPALKGDWMAAEILKQCEQFGFSTEVLQHQLSVRSLYHFGGYGKMPTLLLQYLDFFNLKYDLPLDPVYTGKAFLGLLEDIENGFYTKGDCLVFIHTGGLRS